jgi:hypothetical protein
MALNFKLKLNTRGVNELLTKSIKPDLKKRIDRVQAVASQGMENPDGMTVIDASDHNRARFIVLTTTEEAMHGEANDRRLTRALDAAR